MAQRNSEWIQCKYYEFGKTGSGNSPADPAAPVDGNILQLLAGDVVLGCDCVITAAVTGTITVGDDDDPDGFMTSTEITEATPGAYSGNGAYLTSNAKKYYAVDTKEVKLDQTTISAGAFCIVVRGYKI